MAVRKFSTTKNLLLFEGRDGPAYWRRFVALLTLSVVIATMGLLRNSSAVVIAAMLIAPLMTPILGIAAAIVMGWVRRGLKLLVTVLLAASGCVLLAWVMVNVANVPRGISIPSEVLARTDPGIEELIVALAAGAAGAYVQIQKQEFSLLPGAAIGVALVPPLSAAGILLYFSEPARALEASLLFMTNLASIIAAAFAVYVVSATGFKINRKPGRRAGFRASVAITLVALGLMGLHLVNETVNRFTESRNESRIARAVVDWAQSASVEIVRVDVKRRLRRADLWVIVDLPISAIYSDKPIAQNLPETLGDRPLREVVLDQLAPDYRAVIRFQIRYAGLVTEMNDYILPAPAPSESEEID